MQRFYLSCIRMFVNISHKFYLINLENRFLFALGIIISIFNLSFTKKLEFEFKHFIYYNNKICYYMFEQIIICLFI